MRIRSERMFVTKTAEIRMFLSAI